MPIVHCRNNAPQNTSVRSRLLSNLFYRIPPHLTVRNIYVSLLLYSAVAEKQYLLTYGCASSSSTCSSSKRIVNLSIRFVVHMHPSELVTWDRIPSITHAEFTFVYEILIHSRYVSHLHAFYKINVSVSSVETQLRINNHHVRTCLSLTLLLIPLLLQTRRKVVKRWEW